MVRLAFHPYAPLPSTATSTFILPPAKCLKNHCRGAPEPVACTKAHSYLWCSAQAALGPMGWRAICNPLKAQPSGRARNAVRPRCASGAQAQEVVEARGILRRCGLQLVKGRNRGLQEQEQGQYQVQGQGVMGYCS